MPWEKEKREKALYTAREEKEKMKENEKSRHDIGVCEFGVVMYLLKAQ